MYIIVNLTDETFDLIASVASISYEENRLEIVTDLHIGFSYNLNVVTSFKTITYKEYCMLSSSDKCNHDFYL